LRIHRPALAVAALCGTLLVASGCGGSSSSTTSDTSSTASIVPGDTAAYVAVESDVDSGQWTTLDSLVSQIPGARGAVLDTVSKGLESQDLSFDEDVAPALGPVVVVAVSADGDVVALTQPEDTAKLQQLVATTGASLVTADADGWTAVAESQADIDAYEQSLARGSLAADSSYTEVSAALPQEALLRAYLRVDRLESSAATLGAATGVSNIPGLSGIGAGGLSAVAFSVTAEDDGLRLVGSTAAQGGKTYELQLAKQIPADALVAAAFHGTDSMLDQLREALGGSGALEQFEQVVGVPLEQVVGLVDGEGVLYVREATPLPELTIAVRPSDPAAGKATLDKLAERLADLAGAKTSLETRDGLAVTRIQIEPVTITMARTEETLVLTTGSAGIRTLISSGDKLLDSPSFTAAAEKVGLGTTTAGFFYVDVDGLGPVVEGLADAAGQALPPAALDMIDTFDYVMLNSTADESTTSFTGFIRLRS
jgi:hypothetical protein